MMENGENTNNDGDDIFVTIKGNLSKFFIRDEKSGKSFFSLSTTQDLEGAKTFQRKTTKRQNGKDVTINHVFCNAKEVGVSGFREGTPIEVVGFFKGRKSGCDEFIVKSCRELDQEAFYSLKYLKSSAFEFTNEEAEKVYACIVEHNDGKIFEFAKNEELALSLLSSIGIKESISKSFIKIVKATVLERQLYQFLAPLDIPYPFCAKAVKGFGEKALEEMLRNPYRFGHKLGLTFGECDRIAKKSGILPTSSQRLQAASIEAVSRLASSGHTWSGQRDYSRALGYILRQGSFANLGNLPMSVALSGIKGFVKSSRVNEVESIYLQKLFDDEYDIAKNIIRLSKSQKVEPYNDNLVEFAQQACQMKYGAQQRDAFSTILRQRGVKILTGGPGSGKTTTIKGILLAYKKMHPDHTIKLCAPTGRAAQRMAESCGMPATTIHRLLEYRPYGNDTVHKDATNPIDADFIVVDEMSMSDVEIFDIFLKAVKNDTTVVLVGDIHQLESVGPGAVLHDLLLTNDNIIQKCLLTEVFRQKGGSPIIENASRINEGNTVLETCSDFQIINTKSEEESLEKVKEVMKALYNKKDPFGTQILCPARAGKAGIDNINVVLQRELNPIDINKDKRLIYGHSEYRVGDKILMTRNNYAADYYNGDIGEIKSIIEDGLKVNIRDKEYTLTRENLDDIRLAYGMTIHKSQGSEFPTVVVVMSMEPKVMLVKNLLYTAVTRAKQKVIIINEGTAIETAIKVDRSDNRRTFLNDYLPSK